MPSRAGTVSLLSVAIACVSLAEPPFLRGQSYEQLCNSERQWAFGNGARILGSMVEADLEQISLKLAGKGNVVKGSIDKLERSDGQMVRVAYLDKEDFEQFEKVKDKLPYLHDRVETVADLFLEIHKAHPVSPYAGLWAAVAKSAGTNDYNSAESILRQVVGRIELQNKYGGDRHGMTLCSAYNNLAICQIKDLKGDQAGGYLIKALKTSTQIPLVVNHNTQLLSELADESTQIKFSDGVKHEIIRALANMNSAARGSTLPRGWHYSLDFDVPSDSAGAQKIVGVDPPDGRLELKGMGTGFVVAQGTVLTTQSLFDELTTDGPRLLTVSSPSKSIQWQTHKVRQVISSKTQVNPVRATVLDNDALGQMVWTEFEFIPPPPGTPASELAVLRVPGLNNPAMKFAVEDAAIRSDISVLGYQRGATILSDGVKTQTGFITQMKQFADFSGNSIPITALVDGGNRGGPVIDESGLIVGIAYESASDDPTIKGSMFPTSQIRKWFGEMVHTQDLQSVSEADPNEKLSDNAPLSTVPIFAWGPQLKSDAQFYSRFVDSTQLGGMTIRDDWCLACRGSGTKDCLDPNCKRGVLTGSERVQIGLNKATGQPIYAMRPVTERCRACDGTGGSSCKHCQDGRLKDAR